MNSVFKDIDGVVLKLNDIVVASPKCFYKHKICRGKVVVVEESEIWVKTEKDGFVSIQNEDQVLYLFTD